MALAESFKLGHNRVATVRIELMVEEVAQSLVKGIMPQGYVPLPRYLLAKVLVVELKLVALFLTLLQLC